MVPDVRNFALSVEVLLDEFPVHEIPERLDVLGPGVAVVDVVRVLPHVAGHQRRLPRRERVVRILCLHDQKRLVSVLDEPGPARPEERRCLVAEFLLEGSTHPDAFSGYATKPLSGEALARSIAVAMGDWPRIQEKPELFVPLRRAVVNAFPDLFAEEPGNAIQQALFLSNAALVEDVCSPRDGNLTHRLLEVASVESRVENAFETIFGRAPTSEESAW